MGARTESRARLFISNMLVYGVGGILSKLVPLIMVPVVTRLMPGTKYFGLADLSNTLVSFAQAFALMGMYDAMFRMFFEEDDLDYKKMVCTTALFFVTGCSLVVCFGMVLFADPIARVFFGGVEFTSLCTISALTVLVGGNGLITQAPTRMQNKKVIYIVINLVTSILTYAISVPLILAGEYLLALPIAALLSSAVFLAVFLVINRKWFSLKRFDSRLLREMLAIGVPLMPTFLFYWVFNSADRVMILNLIGVDASGIYAVAAKLGHVSQLVYTAFAQGWQYFAFSTMNDSDSVELKSRVYEYLGVVSFLCTGMLLVVLRPMYGVLFAPQYAEGVYAVPYLFLAPLLLMLFQVASNQLVVVKKTWLVSIVLAIGAVANIVANLVLIPLLGIEGASVATLVGYVITNAMMFVLLMRMNLLAIQLRFGAAVALMAVFLVFWRQFALNNALLALAGFTAFFSCICLLYKRDIAHLAGRLKRTLKKKDDKSQPI